MLALDSPLEFTGCSFLQLYFNQLYESRLSFYVPRSAAPGMTSVVDEAVRTIRNSTVIIDKNIGIKQIFDQTLRTALLEKIHLMNQAEIDAVMTLIPEAQFERMAVGTPCMDKDGKRFTVLGFVDAKQYRREYSTPWVLELEHNFTLLGKQPKIIGLYYDPASPEQQNIVVEDLH